MRIGIDCDNVLYEMIDPLRQTVIKYGSLTAQQCPPPQTWEVWTEWGLSKEEAFELMNAYPKELFGTGEPYEGARAALEIQKQKGHELIVVTARNEKYVGETTKLWLKEHGISELLSGIYFTPEKHEAPVDILIDDSSKHLMQMLDAAKKAIRFSHPWNEDVAHLVNGELNAWSELDDVLNAALN